MRTKLSEWDVGASVIVKGVTGERSLVLRLMEMGVVAGTRLSITRKAPLGDPMELALRGYALSIRKNEASMIEVVSDG